MKPTFYYVKKQTDWSHWNYNNILRSLIMFCMKDVRRDIECVIPMSHCCIALTWWRWRRDTDTGVFIGPQTVDIRLCWVDVEVCHDGVELMLRCCCHDVDTMLRLCWDAVVRMLTWFWDCVEKLKCCWDNVESSWFDIKVYIVIIYCLHLRLLTQPRTEDRWDKSK